MSEHLREVVKALRDALGSDKESYKDLCIRIMLNHLYAESLESKRFSSNTAALLVYLMGRYDPETLEEWTKPITNVYELP
jgi:hypothetical protein